MGTVSRVVFMRVVAETTDQLAPMMEQAEETSGHRAEELHSWNRRVVSGLVLPDAYPGRHFPLHAGRGLGTNKVGRVEDAVVQLVQAEEATGRVFGC